MATVTAGIYLGDSRPGLFPPEHVFTPNREEPLVHTMALRGNPTAYRQHRQCRVADTVHLHGLRACSSPKTRRHSNPFLYGGQVGYYSLPHRSPLVWVTVV